MTGIIDVGGGLRGIYGAGVFDRCLADGLQFDVCIGVSAGSANVAAFIGGQKGRNYRFYTKYPQRSEYMSMRNVLRKGAFIDLSYVYATLSNADGEDPLRYDRIAAYDGQMVLVASGTDGDPVYFTQADMAQDDYRIIRASSSLPVICGGCRIGEKVYYDGGIADPVPYAHMEGLGYDRNVIVLTQPRAYRKEKTKGLPLMRLLLHRTPRMAEAMAVRHTVYNRQMDALDAREDGGLALVIRPPESLGISRTEKDPDELERVYQIGRREGLRRLDEVRAWLNKRP